MTEEATERLVRLFLQYNGFLVRTNVKHFVDKNRNLEVDIVALRQFKPSGDTIPNKIIGYVAGWSLGVKHFEQLHKKFSPKSRKEFKRLKLLSNKKYRKIFLRKIENEYGKGFKFCIFARGITKKHETVVKRFLDKEKIVLIPLSKVIRGMLDYVDLDKYENDSEYQLLRLMKSYDMLRPNVQRQF
jgi:hypothetical protein